MTGRLELAFALHIIVCFAKSNISGGYTGRCCSRDAARLSEIRRWIHSTSQTETLTPSQAKPWHCSSTQAAAAPGPAREVCESTACEIQHGEAAGMTLGKPLPLQSQTRPCSPPDEAPFPFRTQRPCQRGPLPPKRFLLDHVRVELLVPCAVQGVGDIQPLAIHAELHFTGAAVHSLALKAQQTAATLLASFFEQPSTSRSRGAEQSRAAASPPDTGELPDAAHTRAPQCRPTPESLGRELAEQSQSPKGTRGQRGHRTHLDHQGLRLALQLFVSAHRHGSTSEDTASHKDLYARQWETCCLVIRPPPGPAKAPKRASPSAPALPVPPAWACRFWRAHIGGCLRAASC